MSDPSSLRRPAAGRRYDPEAIDATGATLGDYLGAVDDGSGGQRAGYLPLPVTPGDVDPGVGTGTPGNWSHNFVPVDDAGSFVLGAHDDDPEPLGVAKLLKFLLPGAVLRGQATVLVKGAVTAYLDFRVSPDRGATWETDLLGVRVPLRDADDEITANGFTQAIGVAIEVPAEFEGEVLLDPVVVGGNGTDVPEIQSFVLESTSEAPPPADGEGGPVDAGVPSFVTYQWELTEGSGQTVANKKVGGVTAALILGDTTSADGRDPTWTAGPRRLATGGFATVDHHYAHFDSVPSMAAGFAFFGYADITSLGGLAKFFCGSESGAVTDHQMGVDGSNHVFARVTENTGGGTSRVATGTTTISNGSKHFVGFVHVPTGPTTGTLAVYVDPVAGLPEGSVTCGTPLEPTTPRKFVIGAGHTPTTSDNGFDAWAFGDAYVFVGTDAASLTPDDIAALHQQAKLTYTDLP